MYKAYIRTRIDTERYKFLSLRRMSRLRIKQNVYYDSEQKTSKCTFFVKNSTVVKALGILKKIPWKKNSHRFKTIFHAFITQKSAILQIEVCKNKLSRI